MQKRNIIEIVGIVSVVGSLVFVGIEIKQNTSAVRGATQQAVSSQVSKCIGSFQKMSEWRI